jgi:ABC-type uncharacterized transport system permease subunit
MNAFLDIFTLTAMMGILAGAIRIATPLLLAALGESISERAGVLNVGIEGLMALGALSGFVVAYWTGNPWLGFLAALFVGALAGLMFGVMTVLWGSDQVATGIVMNLFCLGIASVVYKSLFAGASAIPTVQTLRTYRVPGLSDIDYIGRVFFAHTPIVYIAFLLVPLVWLLMQRSVWGLNVRAVGENPAAADTAGIDVWSVRLVAVAVGGAFAGVAGATLSIAQLGSYLDNMTAGRGFVALAVVVFGGWNPWRIAGACLIFGGAEALQLRMQASGVPVPTAFLVAIPYVLTILVIVIFAGKAAYPAAINVPYLRRRKTTRPSSIDPSPPGGSSSQPTAGTANSQHPLPQT